MDLGSTFSCMHLNIILSSTFNSTRRPTVRCHLDVHEAGNAKNGELRGALCQIHSLNGVTEQEDLTI